MVRAKARESEFFALTSLHSLSSIFTSGYDIVCIAPRLVRPRESYSQELYIFFSGSYPEVTPTPM